MLTSKRNTNKALSFIFSYYAYDDVEYTDYQRWRKNPLQWDNIEIKFIVNIITYVKLVMR